MTDTGPFHLPTAIPSPAAEPAPPSFGRYTAESGFLSQLIAERDRLPVQRQRRRASLTDAIDAYGSGERRDRRRLPQGFFRSARA